MKIEISRFLLLNSFVVVEIWSLLISQSGHLSMAELQEVVSSLLLLLNSTYAPTIQVSKGLSVSLTYTNEDYLKFVI